MKMNSIQIRIYSALVRVLLAEVLSASGADVEPAKLESKFYKHQDH
jgi:hypothetical protein